MSLNSFIPHYILHRYAFIYITCSRGIHSDTHTHTQHQFSCNCILRHLSVPNLIFYVLQTDYQQHHTFFFVSLRVFQQQQVLFGWFFKFCSAPLNGFLIIQTPTERSILSPSEGAHKLGNQGTTLEAAFTRKCRQDLSFCTTRRKAWRIEDIWTSGFVIFNTPLLSSIVVFLSECSIFVVLQVVSPSHRSLWRL